MKNVIMYTDGSALKAPDGKFYCGSGVVLLYGEHKREISHICGYATVNVAELTAVIIGLESLKESCNVIIYCDSQYTIDTQEKWYSGWERRGWMTQNKGGVKNKELIQRLNYLCNQHRVKWVKVKSHSGDKFNDLADKLAVKASTKFKKECVNGES